MKTQNLKKITIFSFTLITSFSNLTSQDVVIRNRGENADDNFLERIKRIDENDNSTQRERRVYMVKDDKVKGCHKVDLRAYKYESPGCHPNYDPNQKSAAKQGTSVKEPKPQNNKQVSEQNSGNKTKSTVVREPKGNKTSQNNKPVSGQNSNNKPQNTAAKEPKDNKEPKTAQKSEPKSDSGWPKERRESLRERNPN